MPAAQLGRSDLHVSRVIFGAMSQSASGGDEQRIVDTLRAAIDAGVTSIDTAPLYHYGGSEELVGRAVAGRRSQVQLLTKVGLRWDDPRGAVFYRFRDAQGREQTVRRNSRPDSVRHEVERSLSRLGVEVLDLVQVHQPDPDTPIADTMGALADLLREGKLRAIGVSNYSPAQMRKAQAALGAIPLASNQVHYSLLERSIEADTLPRALADRVGVLAYSPLERGLLAGRLRAEELAADDGRRHTPAFHPVNLGHVAAAVERGLQPVAAAHGVSTAQVALAFLLAQPGVSAVIAGASSAEQARRNAAAVTLVLAPDELAVIDKAFARVRIDPYAGQSAARRAGQRMRNVFGKVKRKLMRA